MIPDTMMWARYAAFVGLYFVWVIGYTFQTSCTRSGQTVLTNDPKQRPLFTIFNTVGSLLGMGVMQFLAPILAKNYEGGYSSAGFFRTLAPVGIVMSIALTILAIIGIWEKDQPKYFGIGGEKTEKVKVSEYLQIIRENKPMQRLMIAGAGTKLALSIANNTTVLCMLYGCMMGAYDGLYLPMMVLGYACSVPFFILSVRTSQKRMVCPSTCTRFCSSCSSASATAHTTLLPTCPFRWLPTAPTTRPTAPASIFRASWVRCSAWWISSFPACPPPSSALP